MATLPTLAVLGVFSLIVNPSAGQTVDIPVPQYDLDIEYEDKELLFSFIDRDGDGVLLESDRHLLFDIHPEAAPDKDKFLALTGSQQMGQDLNSEVFMKFLDDKAIKYALFECSFVKSRSLRKECYEDQLITYVHLVLDKRVIKRFYSLFRPTDSIRFSFVRILFSNREGDEVQKEEDAHNFMRELGGQSEIITEKGFDQYVRGKDLHDAFRACYTTGQSSNYDYECLRDSVLDYTTKAMTEMDIAVIFQAIDADGDGWVEPSDVAQWCSKRCDPAAFLKMMSADQEDTLVDYGEFRTFIKKKTVKIRIERGNL